MADPKPNSGQIPGAVAQKMGELVQYAPGSVVSRTIAKNAAGTITAFAFDEGQGLSEHSAPFDAYVQILDGSAELTIGGIKVPARAGEIVLMPANVPHGLHAGEKFKMMLLMLKG